MGKSNKKYAFIADAMLGKIARKLRIFGFNTIYDSDIDDKGILETSKNHGRIVLTSDKTLFNKCKKDGINSILICKDNEIENLVDIFRSLNIKSIKSLKIPFLCTSCNNQLNTIIDKNLIRYEIPDRLRRSNKIFYKCTKCKKIYWSGTHMKQISLLTKEINTKLKSLDAPILGNGDKKVHY